MKFESLAIPEVLLITPRLFKDDRGYFFESFRESQFQEAGINKPFVQHNQSASKKGTLRGLHLQADPHAQAKLVRVPKGRVFDVAVDVRIDSPSYGQWVGAELSEDNLQALYIPEGFAHGFYVLSDEAILTYQCNNYYNGPSERSLRWDDPTIGIDWPIPAGTTPLLSEKDADAYTLEGLQASLTNNNPL